jgi:abortive infection bacteriophage resistance protein
MSENKKESPENEAVAAMGIAVIGFAVAAVIVPITLLSLPFAIVLRSLLDEKNVLARYSLGLIVGVIFYIFFYGVNFAKFDGLLFKTYGPQLKELLFEFISMLPDKWELNSAFPTDLRLYFWITYPVAIVLSFVLKMKDSVKKKKQRDYFQRSESRGFEYLINFLTLVAAPYYGVARAVVKAANRSFTDRLRAQVHCVASIVLTYLLIYLTFGPILSWHVHFGYLLNKGVIIFKIVPPILMEVVKLYFYLGGVVFPIVWWNRRERLKLEIKGEIEILGTDRSYNNGVVYLGVDQNGNKVNLTPGMLNHHVHVVGASGFGKTTFLLNIIKEKIDAGEGLIFVDLKGDIDTTCEIVSFVENANRLDDFEFFSISEDFLELSKGISLFENGNAIEIKDKIMGAFRYDHDYYKKRIESFLTLALRPLVYLRDNENEPFDLSSIYKLILGFEHIEELASKVKNKEFKRDLESMILDKKLREDLTGLRSDIEGIIKTDFGHLVSKTGGINLYDSIRNSKIVFIHLDSQRYEHSAEKLGKLILQDIKTASAKIVTTIPKHDRNPFTLIVDEFANLATEQFVGFLNRARASGIGIVIAHQELSDLDLFSQVVKDQIMTNTSTLFSFLQKLPKSAEMIAGIAGTYQTEKETNQISEEGFFFKTKEKTGMGSLREVEEYIIHPNLIKELNRGECFMISKYPYTKIGKVFVNFVNGPVMSKAELMMILGQRKTETETIMISYARTPESKTEEQEDGDWL